MKVVLDTNVLLAAIATRGLCDLVLTECLLHHEMIISTPILAEFNRHLTGKFKMSATLAGDIITFTREHSRMVEPTEIPSDACRDSVDLMVLGTAVAGGAIFIVTGDKDLLIIQNFQGIAIITPREFYQRTTLND